MSDIPAVLEIDEKMYSYEFETRVPKYGERYIYFDGHRGEWRVSMPSGFNEAVTYRVITSYLEVQEIPVPAKYKPIGKWSETI